MHSSIQYDYYICYFLPHFPILFDIVQFGLDYVRGAEIEGMLDEQGKLIEEGPEPKPEFKGDKRTFRVWLDTNQYQQDMATAAQGSEVCNLLV